MATRTAEHPRCAILASGRGSNARALLDAVAAGQLPCSIVGVVANVVDAPVLELARSRGIRAETVPHKGLAREAHEEHVRAVLTSMGAQHLLLAGYMRVVSADFIQRWPGYLLNIHPSLLPEFPGLHAAERQWEARVPIAGATVHFVDAGVDSGPVLLQGSLVARGDEGADGLAARLLTEVEHVIYPRAVRLFLDRLARGALPPTPNRS